MSDTLANILPSYVTSFFTEEQIAQRKADLEKLAIGEPAGTDGAGALGYIPPGQEQKISSDTPS